MSESSRPTKKLKTQHDSDDGEGDANGPPDTASANTTAPSSRGGDDDAEGEEARAFIFESVIERYFTRYYIADVAGRAREDQYLHQHSNLLVVVGLAAHHPLLAADVAAVTFAPGKNRRDLSEIRPQGKKKRGAFFTQADTALCEATTAAGAVYTVRAGVRGSLLEVNTRLLRNPRLLAERPETEGYVAIISVRPHDWAASLSGDGKGAGKGGGLLTRDQYLALRAPS